jgi:hypothetical protein
MSSELNQIQDENLRWRAGDYEAVGAGLSAIFLGSAFFFPETRMVFATASVLTAGIDMVVMAGKAVANNTLNQIAREINHEVRIYQAGKKAQQIGVDIDINKID